MNRKIALRLVRNVLIAVIALCLQFVFLSQLQSAMAMNRQQANSGTKLAIAAQRLLENAADADADWAIYDNFLADKVDTVAWLLDAAAAGEEVLTAAAEQWGLCRVYLADSQGNITYASEGRPATLEEAGLGRLLAFARGEDDRPYVTLDNVCHYMSRRADDSYLVGGIDCTEMIAAQDERYTAAYSLRDIKVGQAGFVLAVNTADSTVAYAPDEALIGQPASVLGMDEALVQGTSGYITWQGEAWHYQSAPAHADKNDYLLVAMVPKAELTDSSAPVVWTAMIISALAAAALIVFMLLLDLEGQDEARCCRVTKHICLNLSAGKRLRTVAVAALAVLVAASAFVNCLTNVSRQALIFESKLTDVDEILARNDERTAAIKAAYEDEYTRRAVNVAATLDAMPELCTNENLNVFAAVACLDSVSLFNGQGKITATSTPYTDYALSKDENDQSYPFWKVVKGYIHLLVQPAMPNESTGDLVQYIGVARDDGPGMVQISMLPTMLERRL
ncbi:MAG: hypothetical protein Q4C54_10695 [Clostridia bacterium]|nr:hypothetical protein [Clostridia bacterium]